MGETVFACKPEEDPSISLRYLAGSIMNCRFDDPNLPFDNDKFMQARERIGDRVIFYDNYQSTEWADVKKAIREVVIEFGVRRIFIDPITCFTVGQDASTRNETLTTIASEIAAMAKELDFTYFIFCHLNTPDSGKPHERGGSVQSIQFAGSRSMQRFTHYMIGLEGNKDPDLPEEVRNLRDLVVLEDRNFGEAGKVHLFYDKSTGSLEEIEGEGIRKPSAKQINV